SVVLRRLAPYSTLFRSSSLGKSGSTVFFKVTLPLITPGVGAGMALVFLEVMKELTATLLLRPTGVNTLATKIWEHTTSIEYGASAPYAVLLILISGLPVYLLTMRSFRSRKRGKSMKKLHIRSLSKTFQNVHALNNIQVDLTEGHMLSVLGPSGCGKTTLLRSIAGFETPDTGVIEIDGERVFDSSTN